MRNSEVDFIFVSIVADSFYQFFIAASLFPGRHWRIALAYRVVVLFSPRLPESR